MKWRKVKKHLQKFKEKSIGLYIIAKDNNGTELHARMTDLKIRPAGGRKVFYDFQAEPIHNSVDALKNEPQEEPQEHSDNGCRTNEWSMSFDMKIENPTKELRQLINN